MGRRYEETEMTHQVIGSARIGLWGRVRIVLYLGLALTTVAQAAVPTVSLTSDQTNHLVETDLSSASLSLSAGTGTYDLQLKVTDWNGNQVHNQTFTNVTGGWSTNVQLTTDHYSSYEVTAELVLPGQQDPVTTGEMRLVRAVPVPQLSAEQRRDSYIGVNTHWWANWEGIQRVGGHWGRDYSWGWLGDGTNAPSAPNGANFDYHLNQANAAGVTVLPIMMNAFHNASNTAYIDNHDYVADSYERLSNAFPDIEYWELDNEPSYTFDNPGDPPNYDLDNYRRYIHAAAEGIARAGHAEVVLAGTGGVHYDNTVSLLSGSGVSPVVRDDFSVVNYHQYTYHYPPEEPEVTWEPTLLENITPMNDLAHANGKQAWLTEIGWDVEAPYPAGERNQAIYLPRGYLLPRAAGTDKVFWYFERDVGETGRFATSGLFDLDLVAKPSAATLAALSKFTALSTVLESGEFADGALYVTMVDEQGRQLLVTWTIEGETTLPEHIIPIEAYDMFGNPVDTNTITPEVTYYYISELLVGDANSDGAVTDADYTIWADNYGTVGATVHEGDFNGSGIVTDADYTLWADNYGAGSESVPEPSALALGGLLGLAALRKRTTRVG
jgi:hypothetical protein